MVAMQAYRYLNTYHDGISDEDREWNKFEEKDYVELGTSGLMVSRVSYLFWYLGPLSVSPPPPSTQVRGAVSANFAHQTCWFPADSRTDIHESSYIRRWQSL